MSAFLRRFRWALVFGAVLLLLMNAYGFFLMKKDLDELTKSKRSGLIWNAARTEIELLQFTETLSQFIAAAPGVTEDTVRFRFDLLWSQHSSASRKTPISEGNASIEEASVLEDLGEALRLYEDDVARLDASQRELGRDIIFALQELPAALNKYTNAVKDYQSDMDLNARMKIGRTSDFLFATSILSIIGGLVMVSVFFADSRRQVRITRDNAVLYENAKLAYKAKTEFLSTISHELRTPLTSIKGSIRLLDATHTGEVDVKRQALLDMAIRNCDRLERLINDVLEIDRAERGELSITTSVVDAASPVKAAVEAISNYIPDRQVLFTLPKEYLPVDVDSVRIEQVVANLLSNALKFSSKDGAVTVAVKRAGQSVRISVSDQGTGIPAAFRDKIFEKFTQADSSNSRAVSGTGLGLSIAKQIVERHSGVIDFVSEEGVGTTFFVDLPLAESANVRPKVA